MQKLKHISAITVEDYIALPKKQREKFGFYLTPKSMKLGEYEKFEQYVKKTYPVQAWFREDFLFNLSCVGFKIKRLKSSIRNIMKPNHPRYRNSYPRKDYKDVDSIIEDGMFALILDFWYEECWPTSIVDWQHDDEHKRIYKWLQDTVEVIETTLPKLRDEYDKELSLAAKRKDMPYVQAYDKANKLEAQIQDLTTKILHEIIDYRDYLWT